MGEVKIIVSLALLMEAVHIPPDKNYRIIDAKISDHARVFADNKLLVNDINIELIVQGDEFPPTPYNTEPLLVNPIIHFEREKYILDWNLPKKEKNEDSGADK